MMTGLDHMDRLERLMLGRRAAVNGDDAVAAKKSLPLSVVEAMRREYEVFDAERHDDATVQKSTAESLALIESYSGREAALQRRLDVQQRIAPLFYGQCADHTEPDAAMLLPALQTAALIRYSYLTTLLPPGTRDVNTMVPTVILGRKLQDTLDEFLSDEPAYRLCVCGRYSLPAACPRCSAPDSNSWDAVHDELQAWVSWAGAAIKFDYWHKMAVLWENVIDSYMNLMSERRALRGNKAAAHMVVVNRFAASPARQKLLSRVETLREHWEI